MESWTLGLDSPFKEKQKNNKTLIFAPGTNNPLRRYNFEWRSNCDLGLSGRSSEIIMAKRELSSTLKNLKFMQRAALREEKSKKEDEVKPNGNIFETAAISRKCIVIMEGDPHPGAIKGRMSFKSFNPRIDRLNEEESALRQTAAETSVSRNQSVNISTRENGAPVDGPGCANPTKNEDTADLKRKQPEVMSEAQCPNKSPKNEKGDCHTSPENSLWSFKKPKGVKLDWSVLRPPKC